MLLSDICEIIMGQSPSSGGYNVKGQGLPFFMGMLILVNCILLLDFGAIVR